MPPVSPASHVSSPEFIRHSKTPEPLTSAARHGEELRDAWTAGSGEESAGPVSRRASSAAPGVPKHISLPLDAREVVARENLVMRPSKADESGAQASHEKNAFRPVSPFQGVDPAVMARAEALIPVALSDKLIAPNEIEGHVEHAELRRRVLERDSQIVRDRSVSQSAGKKSVEEINLEITKITGHAIKSEEHLDLFAYTTKALQSVPTAAGALSYVSMREILKASNDALARDLHASQLEFTRACRALNALSEDMDSFPESERASLSAAFDKCVSRVNQVGARWVSYTMVGPSLGSRYVQLRNLSAQRNTFKNNKQDYREYLNDILANRAEVKASRHEAARELWSVVNTLKGIFELAEQQKNALSSSEIRAPLVNMLRSFTYLVRSTDMHTEPMIGLSNNASGRTSGAERENSGRIEGLTKVPDRREKLARLVAAEQKAGRYGAALAEEAITSLTSCDPERELHVLVPILSDAAYGLNAGISGAIHSLEEGLSGGQLAQVIETLQACTKQADRSARTYEEIADWLSGAEEEKALDTAARASSGDLGLHNLHAHAIVMRDFCATMAWAGAKALANSGDRGITPPAIELPPVAGDEVVPSASSSAKKKTKTKQRKRQAGRAAADITSGNGESTGERQATPPLTALDEKSSADLSTSEPLEESVPSSAHTAGNASSLLSDYLPEVKGMPREDSRDSKTVTMAERPGFLEIRDDINNAIEVNLDQARLAREAARACYSNSRYAHFTYTNTLYLQQMAAHLRRTAASLRDACEVLRKKSQPHLGEGRVLFPQFQEDLKSQADECEKIASWTQTFSEDPRSQPLTTANFRDLRRQNFLTYTMPNDRTQEGIVFTSAGLPTTEILAREQSIKLWNGRNIPGRQFVVHPHFVSWDAIVNQPLEKISVDHIQSVRVKHMEHRKISYETVATVDENGFPVTREQRVPFATLTPEEGLTILQAALKARRLDA